MTQVAEAQALGLTASELGRIIDLLGREPNSVELAVFSLLWSEHCAYKHSKKLLRKLPTEGPRVLMGPGENAGAVDAGDGLAVVFKVESHNHPSAVEPFQGAATGVGGILRDVFALGARPVAVLDSLRFGDISTPRTRYLLERVVAGIGAYGNSVGVPTVGGEIYFEPPYEQNCLVNAMCVGLAPAQRLIRSAAAGPGNVLVLIGALTGRDGIGGASVLASAELGEGEGDKRPTRPDRRPVRGEPADRVLPRAGRARGCSSRFRTSAQQACRRAPARWRPRATWASTSTSRRVPLREAGMEPFEIMISESQERMLCVVEPQRLDDVLALCARWEVRATPIGEVTDTRRLRVFDGDELVGDMPVAALVDECPLYDLEPQEPEDRLASFAPPRAASARMRTHRRRFRALLGSENVACRRWVFEQYDCLVGSRTVRRPEQADAAVLRLASARSRPTAALAVSIDGNGRRVACDPYIGAAEAVCECAANLACVGGRAARPHELPQLRQPGEAPRRLAADAGGGGHGGRLPRARGPRGRRQRLALQRGDRGADYPTPVVGMVGELPDARRAGTSALAAGEGRMVALVGPFSPSLLGSELTRLEGRLEGRLEPFDLRKVREALEVVRDAVRAGVVASAHDVCDGGLAACVAESAIQGGVGPRSTSSRSCAAPGSIAHGTVRRGARGRPRVRSARLTAGAEHDGDAAGVGFLALGTVAEGVSKSLRALLGSTSR